MNQLTQLKNLIMDVLADSGEPQSPGRSLNALNHLKIDQEIKAPIIINQINCIFSTTVRQNLVSALVIIDNLEKKQNEIFPISLRNELNNTKKDLITKALDAAGGNHSLAAKYLSVKRPTLIKYINEMGLNER